LVSGHFGIMWSTTQKGYEPLRLKMFQAPTMFWSEFFNNNTCTATLKW